MSPPDPVNGSSEQQVKLSKLLSFLLRHRPDSVGLTLEPDGWVAVEELIARINARRRLPFSLDQRCLEELVQGEGHRRFELRDGKVRARGGHSVAGVEVPPPLEDGTPEFLYARLPRDEVERARERGIVAAGPGNDLRLSPDEPPAPDGGELVILEAARASRNGVRFEGDGQGGFRADSVPLRYAISLRPGFQRQISAGGVLVRGRGGETQFALIRTLPRDEVEAHEPPEFQDPRAGDDRRSLDRRRNEQPPPDGVERRKQSRRQRRRRRSGRWGPEGRLELPKGKLEAGETPEQAAIREVQEELGVDAPLVVHAALSRNHYAFRTPEGLSIFKTVHYFLLRCPGQEPEFTPRREEGIISVEWWNGQRAISQVAFRNLRPILERAWALVQDEG